jgi:hypothetical protein
MSNQIIDDPPSGDWRDDVWQKMIHHPDWPAIQATLTAAMAPWTADDEIHRQGLDTTGEPNERQPARRA